jgi:hypothetical protein
MATPFANSRCVRLPSAIWWSRSSSGEKAHGPALEQQHLDLPQVDREKDDVPAGRGPERGRQQGRRPSAPLRLALFLPRGLPVRRVRALVPWHGLNEPHPSADARVHHVERVQSELASQRLGLRGRSLESCEAGDFAGMARRLLPPSKILPLAFETLLYVMTYGDKNVRAEAEELWREYGPRIKRELKRLRSLN